MDLLKLFLQPIREHKMFVLVACVLIVLDVVFGFTNAALKREISSKKMREGLQHKLGSIFLMCTASVIDSAFMGGIDLGFDAPVLAATCVYIAVMEVISCLENIAKLNPELAHNPLIGGVTSRLASVAEEESTEEENA